MPGQIITNISCLVNVRSETGILRGKALTELPVTEQAYLVVEDGIIKESGSMQNAPADISDRDALTDARGAAVLPAWCDSHTHLVFAASRETEFVDKIKGMTYAEIAAKGGGILNSAKKLQETDENKLFELALQRLYEVIRLGTGAIEIKSGYGLTVEGELKMLRVIQRLKTVSPIPIKATFLGAHAYPEAYKQDHEGYLKLITDEMLPNIGKEGLADYIDAFCENGFFSPGEMMKVCEAGFKYGLQPKLHVNQLNSIGGIEAGIALDAVSLDHLETLTPAEIDLLSGSMAAPSGKTWKGICTLLPTAAYFLRMQYQPARKLIDAGSSVALASDFNPGSSPSGNMNIVVSMSCIQMKMLPEEAINAATINGAYAMGLGDMLGSIMPGKKANLIFTKPIPSIAYLPYSFGSNLIDRVMINGKFIS